MGLSAAVVVLLGTFLLPYDAFARGSAIRSLLLLVVVAGALAYAVSRTDVGDRVSAAVAADEPPPLPVVSQTEMPAPQQALLAAVGRGRDAYASGVNDMARGAARPVRAREVCSAVADLAARDWVGLVNGLSSRPDGRGVLSVDVGERIAVTTRTNADSDRGDNTLIEPGSPVFAQASRLKVGRKVRFSGRFAASETDCLKEASLTLAASMQRPEYLMVFTEIAPIE